MRTVCFAFKLWKYLRFVIFFFILRSIVYLCISLNLYKSVNIIYHNENYCIKSNIAFSIKMFVKPILILVKPTNNSLISRGFMIKRISLFLLGIFNSGWIHVYIFISKGGYLLVDKGYTRNIYTDR